MRSGEKMTNKQFTLRTLAVTGVLYALATVATLAFLYGLFG